ncbi:MAG: hypothetical protein IJZ47_07905 [Oscillospiraceae bacterium]|nr:hypothetical protein [Oscillospiraceae bacterium]
MALMLLVVACYTICSLSDKYAVAKLKFDGNSLTFLMAAATSLLMLFYLPFDSRVFLLSWQSFAAILLMATSKMLEFQLAAVILKEMSAFELKAWLGITVFLSYGTDLVSGVSALGIGTVWKFGFIALSAVGLFMIAKSGGRKINYRAILLPLIGYLGVKFGYGLIVRLFCGDTCYISPTLSLFFALVLCAVILAPKVHPVKLFREKTKGSLFVSVTKIPNVIGLVCENIVATQSMANYSFIQPMILVVLFFIGLIRREECTKLNVIGGIVCIAGIIGFQLF